MKQVLLIGAGGHAREVLDVIESINDSSPQYEVLGYIVDPQYGTAGSMVNGVPILGGLELLARYQKRALVVCAVGPSHLRYGLVRRSQAEGCTFATLVHPSAIITRRVTLGAGVVVTAGCILTNQIVVGDHAHLNLGCTVGHDSILEPFVTLAQGVHVSGHVRIGTGSCVGTGVNIIQNINIGSWSIVGAGSTVIRDVPANTTVVGVPARVIKERCEGWQLE
ncbi:MAG TPA: acetyltransferase [Anaerolineae bacterium]|nr:acetyltransferase [Anaerolineae bacterium]